MGIFSDWQDKYFKAGFSVIPVDGQKAFLSDWTKYCVEPAEDDLRDEWANNFPNHNIGLCTGRASGVIGFDLDTDDPIVADIVESLLPKSPVIKFGAKGWTAFYKYSGQITQSLKVNGIQILDILSDGRQTVLPPSIHPKINKPYRWISDHHLLATEQNLPNLLQDQIDNIIKAVGGAPIARTGQLQSSGRNNALKAYVCALADKKSINEIVDLAVKYDSTVFSEDPLFLDKNDFKDNDSWANAFDFVSSITKSILKKKRERKEPIRLGPTPAEIVTEFTKDDLLEILPHWSYTKKGEPTAPRPTLENLAALFDYVGISIKYNIISKQEEITVPNEMFSVDNEANAALACVLSIQARANLAAKHTKEYLTRLADKNAYNPVAIWLESKPWDGQSRLHKLYATITAKNEKTDPNISKLKNILIRRWMVSAVAAAFNPRGVSAHGVLVLQGAQYIGKTAWLKSLVPKELNLIADGRYLRPDDKDSVNQAIRYWIVELGELDATFRKSDIAQLKAFITRDVDLFRRAFAPCESHFARRTVFFASVNETQFLSDSTGNRRFWTIECDKIHYEHGLDMQQIWAEVFDLYKAQEPWVLTHEEMTMLNAHNESFTSKDPVEELVNTQLRWHELDTPALVSMRTATDVLKSLGISHPNQGQVKKASQEIFKLNGGVRAKSGGVMKLKVPPAEKLGDV